jgi:hypothetical protein
MLPILAKGIARYALQSPMPYGDDCDNDDADDDDGDGDGDDEYQVQRSLELRLQPTYKPSSETE